MMHMKTSRYKIRLPGKMQEQRLSPSQAMASTDLTDDAMELFIAEHEGLEIDFSSMRIGGRGLYSKATRRQEKEFKAAMKLLPKGCGMEEISKAMFSLEWFKEVDVTALVEVVKGEEISQEEFIRKAYGYGGNRNTGD